MGHVVLTSTLDIKGAGRSFTGTLILKTTESLTLTAIKGMVCFNAKGRMRGHRNEIQEITIPLNTSKLMPYSDNKFTFAFELPLDSSPSYEGHNVSFYYSCDIDLVFDEASYKSLEKSVFRKMISFVSSNTEINITENFDFWDTERKLTVVPKDYEFKLQPNKIIVFTVIGLMALLYGAYIYLNGVEAFAIWHIPVGIILTAISVGLATMFVGKRMGKLKMRLSPIRNDDFNAMFSIPFNYNLTNAKIYYRVIEKVVDSRGSSSSTRTNVLFESKTHPLYTNKNTQNILVDFPNEQLSPSVKAGGADILWRMFIVGEKNNMNYELYTDFEVKKL